MNSWTTSGVKYRHCPLIAYTVGLCWVLYVIIALEKHARSDDVRRAMLSSPLDNTHVRTTLGATYLHGPWEAPTAGLRRAWHAIIALVLNTPLDQVGCGMPTWPFGSTHG